jgi:outer membrane protein OmpA-like peptidoglycan-associated protein
MQFHNGLFPATLCLVVSWSAAIAPARADCVDLSKRLNQAMSSRQLSAMQELDARIANDGTCTNPDIQAAHRAVGMLQFDMMKAMMQKGAPAADYEPLLTDAAKVLWDAATVLGNIKSKQRKFVDATLAYERALELIKDIYLTPAAPDKKTVQAIFDSAAEAKALAANEEGGAGKPTYVAAAKDHRTGMVGGTMSESIRGFTPTVVPVPIGFETASAKFTETGQKAAGELLLALQQQNPASLTLVGHTDERGDADRNLSLSDQRVKALAAFLKQNGVTAKIETVAKGKTQPLQITDPSQYSREEIWALNRRVEWKR